MESVAEFLFSYKSNFLTLFFQFFIGVDKISNHQADPQVVKPYYSKSFKTRKMCKISPEVDLLGVTINRGNPTPIKSPHLVETISYIEGLSPLLGDPLGGKCPRGL